MGFRSTFISEDMRAVEIPAWFIEKYPLHSSWVNDANGKHFFPIAQLWESKFYAPLAETEIFLDIQRIIQEHQKINGFPKDVVLVLLHECGGITRVKITEDTITGLEPEEWKKVTSVEHNYCYGCSGA